MSLVLKFDAVMVKEINKKLEMKVVLLISDVAINAPKVSTVKLVYRSVTEYF